MAELDDLAEAGAAEPERNGLAEEMAGEPDDDASVNRRGFGTMAAAALLSGFAGAVAGGAIRGHNDHKDDERLYQAGYDEGFDAGQRAGAEAARTAGQDVANKVAELIVVLNKDGLNSRAQTEVYYGVAVVVMPDNSRLTVLKPVVFGGGQFVGVQEGAQGVLSFRVYAMANGSFLQPDDSGAGIASRVIGVKKDSSGSGVAAYIDEEGTGQPGANSDLARVISLVPPPRTGN